MCIDLIHSERFEAVRAENFLVLKINHWLIHLGRFNARSANLTSFIHDSLPSIQVVSVRADLRATGMECATATSGLGIVMISLKGGRMHHSHSSLVDHIVMLVIAIIIVFEHLRCCVHSVFGLSTTMVRMYACRYEGGVCLSVDVGW